MNSFTGWRKSRRSGTQSACVELGYGSDNIGIRDTKNRDGGTLVVGRAAFAGFLDAIKADRLR
ncbi:hypothetical protein FHR81_005592 [Actinoalloteichus hoggarensis]|uniref:Uncharacterized protein n=1 Tax=Actinoalloteichus hoggarensis TaxID=1470176 RepID=A0A221W7S6_9PSEU|nr:DUF397 domain-containing protein [Actinoalloteichus hoggarensis]ASO21945.1 hypothetical protein AHOG_21645 [Actinoalloteichus hoggarensis]MBB5924507.1 hypothetical protein [Actinoalloteichus hoggarensis]